jgi:hypothetical protein
VLSVNSSVVLTISVIISHLVDNPGNDSEDSEIQVLENFKNNNGITMILTPHQWHP